MADNKAVQTRTAVAKKTMLEALEKSLGIVTTAAKNAGISRQEHYNWLKTDEEYKKAVESLEDMALDFAESKLFESIDGGSDAATIFYMKTKGKKRGYVERFENDTTLHVNKPIIIDWSGNDNEQNNTTHTETTGGI